MTLLLVNKFHYLKGGAERYYLDLGDFLTARGDRVIYLSMRHPSNRPAGPDDAFIPEIDFRSRMGMLGRLRGGHEEHRQSRGGGPCARAGQTAQT